ncbi:glucose-1-phosphate thymidylyltransferase [Alkaliphilus sp. MSJ-5]|uniref:Glucose-1-phosphate thymidylyltransferase n=1 Tax=Alkaliphilus flagellatus TaxID=2841507 RepID=A0ABS6FXY9_9FIRM|nr:glucose-1-phosphate thymidylyltransferase [Alkaliphilus flagellatus]MBU5675084.1 glucose-1-phosphate thymidylyltransferase [Alkaliphilus flagellatus]
MKGLILCAGVGSRLWPITHTLPKHLIPLANKPILFYIIDILVDMGIDEIGIVVGKNKASFQEALKEYDNKNIAFHYIKQEKPIGLANAVLSSREFIKNEKFLMILGDNLYHPDIKNAINNIVNSNFNCHVLINKVSNPSRYGIVKIEKDRVIDVIEKPNNPPTNLAIAGIYIFDSNIFTACENIKPSNRNEYELSDAIKWLIDNGYVVSYEKFDCLWQDLGKPEDILIANQYLLSNIKPENNGIIDKGSKIDGMVFIGNSSIVKNSIITGPVTIGNNTIIKDAYIGPYTSIYDNVEITNCHIQNSIILNESIISDIRGIIDSSIIERCCIVEGEKEETKTNQLLLGKDTKIKLKKS